MNADAVAALLREGIEAFRLTREYVGEDLLPPLPGWSWFDWCEKAEAALAAAPLPEPVYDFAWLIERGQPEGQVPTVWWWLAAGGREGWTEVATEAFHFESREAAEEIIAAKFTPPTSRGEASARAVEHSFIAAAPLPSEPVGRWEAVKQAPLLSDLRDAICFVERHDHLATSSYCQAGRAQAYRIREALIARYQFAAPSDTPADGLDVERRRSMKKQGRSTFLLMSEFEQLEEWCRLVRTVFDGETPFLVGSVHSKPTFRDVDLRLILPDAAFDDAWRDPVKVRLMNRAISVWGQQETSLPIDFQIQRMTEANEQFGGEFRNPMGVRDWTAIPTSGIPRPDTDQEDRP